MGVLTRLAAWYLGKSTSGTQNPEQWFTDWVRGGQESASGIVVSQLEALRDVVTMACVSIRSADLAKLPVNVRRRKGNGGTEILRSHAVQRVLNRPNSWQTKFEFFEMMQALRLLKGNAYAPVIWNGRGQPTAMVPVNPERVGLYEAPGGDLFYQITRGSQHEIAELASLPFMVSAEDVLHLRGLSLNGLMGVSMISTARDAIGLSLALERYSSSLFARGARPGGVLETDKRLADATFKRFAAQWKQRYAGLDNAGETPILEEGLKWKPSTMTSVESQTVEARRLQIEQIATAFDVPLHRLGIVPEGGGQAILQSHQMYLNNTLSTDAERWENKLNDMFGLDGDETFVEFDLDYFNRADIQTRLTALRTGVIGSIYKINEARRLEGLPDVEGGDVILQPQNVAPFPYVPPAGGKGPGSDTTGEPAPGGDGDPAAVPDSSKGFSEIDDRLAQEGEQTRAAIRSLESTVRSIPSPVTNITAAAPPPIHITMPEQVINVAAPDQVINVTVPERETHVAVNMPKPGAERVTVTEHSEDGRIKTYVKTPIDIEEKA